MAVTKVLLSGLKQLGFSQKIEQRQVTLQPKGDVLRTPIPMRDVESELYTHPGYPGIYVDVMHEVVWTPENMRAGRGKLFKTLYEQSQQDGDAVLNYVQFIMRAFAVAA